MSDNSDEHNRKEKHADVLRTNTTPSEIEDDGPSETEGDDPVTNISEHITLENEAKDEGNDDEDTKPPALNILFEPPESSPSIRRNNPQMSSDAAVSSHDFPYSIHASMSGTASDHSPHTSRPFIPEFRFHDDDHNFTEAFDLSTQTGGHTEGQTGNAASHSPPEGVDFQQIAYLGSSSTDLGADVEAVRDNVARMPLEYHYSSFFQGTQQFWYDFSYPPPPPNHPQSNHPGQYLPAPTHTPIQPSRYPAMVTAVAALPPEGNEDDDSSSDKKPASPDKAKANSKSKAQNAKAVPKKKSKLKKRRTRASRNSNGSSSSSSSGGANSDAYIHICPSLEELQEVRTERARIALESWYQRLRDLWRFRAIHGHTRVPQKYTENRELGVWVNKQRMEKKTYDEGNKKSSMTQAKIDRLEQAGFVWAKPKGVDAWEQKFEELQDYITEHGDPHVPTKYPDNRALGRWVSTQRNMYKKYHSGGRFNNLSTEEIERRIALLQSLRFSWNMSPSSGSDSANNDDSQEDDGDEYGTD